MNADTHDGHSAQRDQWFVTTHWSVVLNARTGSDEGRQNTALASLCGTYWPPIYTYVRRAGHSQHDAEDLTQEFIRRLLAKDFLANVSPVNGKFRSFILTSLKHFLINERQRAAAAKRGGGITPVPLDVGPEEDFLHSEPASHETPDALFDRRWALGVLERALARLRAEFEAAGKLVQFERLRSHLIGEGERGDQNVAARDLNMTVSAVGVAVYRMKHRFSEIVRSEIANTVSSPEEIDTEMEHLVAVLREGAGRVL